MSGIRKATCLFLSLMLAALLGVNITVSAGDTKSPAEAPEPANDGGSRSATMQPYYDYLESMPKNAAYPSVQKVLTISDVSDKSDIDSNENAESIILSETSKSVSFEFSIEEEGYYALLISYVPLMSTYLDIEFSVKLDGQVPYSEASVLKLKRVYKDEKEITYDSRGNAIRPSQVQVEHPLEEYIRDVEGIYPEPIRFYLTKGVHALQLDFVKADVSIERITLCNPDALPSYEEYRSQISGKTGIKTGESVIIEAEDAHYKSDSTLYPVYDRSDPATSPSHPTKLVLNTIGGTNWSSNGQWITWQIDIPESGFYKLSFRARQNLAYGITSCRSLYIDDKQLFKEMGLLKFPYGSNWTTVTFGGDNPYEIYLEKGLHEIKLKAVLGELAEVYSVLEDAVYELNTAYRKIIMITGTNPDRYIDYMVHKDIPDLLPTFERIKDTLAEQKARMASISDKSADNQGTIEALIVQLEGFLERPSSIPYRLNQFTANIASLSAWLLTIKEQPLELDTIILAPYDEKTPISKSNFFQRLFFHIRAVIGSFTTDYQMVGDYYDDDESSLTVWVGQGREQAQLIKDLVDNSFVPEKHIKVNINLVQQGLIEATLARKGPDIALFVAASDPVNLATRGALVNLLEFSDCEDVISQFQSQAVVPFMHEGGLYALPLTQQFPMMFYRSDIFEELEISPPDTWEEVYQIASVLQRNKLNIGIGADISTFATLLFQKGGGFYNEDRTATRFSEESALEAFTQWTDFYRKYSMPLTYDIQTRFRTGEMPLVITQYSFSSTLQVVAPELQSLWEMVPVPGTLKDDGSIDRSVCGGSVMTAAILFSRVESKENGWEFLKWLVSEDIQARYGQGIELMMGPSARYPTANIEAFKRLPWNPREQASLLAQWEWIKEIPEIPASYYISRNLNNAFRSVINYDSNPRHTLNQYNYEMNKEITRKRQEFNLPVQQDSAK